MPKYPLYGNISTEYWEKEEYAIHENAHNTSLIVCILVSLGKSMDLK